ncbi:PilZ domain-containing protein [Enterocloster hominis (ex Hitch et al. 2024)]|uniref:PilZ domain-containing protein n=1 Tax=Enterocloster hominis (ex Hitch et al. 2024) TaxID=1917870 RepID=UPI001F32D7CE|nr:PilZ domain-containing protein [Lachnoclostridium pacaense]
MVDLLDGYVGSSCVIKAKNNDLISMGVLHRIGKNFIDVGSSRNELPGIPYNLLVKLEIYNTQLGFKVLIGRVYLSSPKLARIIDLNEATNDERREYFRISTRDTGIIYNCMRGDDVMEMEGGSKDVNGLKVQLVDISLGGLMFRSREEFRTNDRFNMVIPAMGDSMLYTCEVRRQVQRPEGDYGYGCEFMEMATRQEDLLYRYILRRQGDQLRRIR